MLLMVMGGLRVYVWVCACACTCARMSACLNNALIVDTCYKYAVLPDKKYHTTYGSPHPMSAYINCLIKTHQLHKKSLDHRSG